MTDDEHPAEGASPQRPLYFARLYWRSSGEAYCWHAANEVVSDSAVEAMTPAKLYEIPDEHPADAGSVEHVLHVNTGSGWRVVPEVA